MTLSLRRVTLCLAMGCAICASAPAVLAQSSPAQSSPAQSLTQFQAVLSGKWLLSCTGGRGRVRQVSLDITQQGATLSGSYAGGRRSGRLQGSVQGTEVSFELAGKRGNARFTGTTDGNTLQVQTGNGVSCKATRQ